MLKIESWNVNGIRACLAKGFLDWLEKESPDILGLQETKAGKEQVPVKQLEMIEKLGYQMLWNPAKRPGYSGTALFSKMKPARTAFGFGIPEFDCEGRVIEARFEDAPVPFTLFNIYYPNGQKDDDRLKYKLAFYDAFLDYAGKLKKKKEHIVVMGDFNTAHREIDLKNPKENEDYSGFLPVERAWIDKFISRGYTDTFRHFHPEPDQYSWWTYRFQARARNIGWRIDYVFTDDGFLPNVKDGFILKDVAGSDHCPVGVILK